MNAELLNDPVALSPMKIIDPITENCSCGRVSEHHACVDSYFSIAVACYWVFSVFKKKETLMLISLKSLVILFLA